MSDIYCDEAGNSGENLLDPIQPIFVLASNDFSRSEALELLEHVRSTQGGEPKFKTLKRSPDGNRRLMRLLTDPRLNRHRVCVDAYHKRFMIVTKLVDLIAETLLHDMGEDLYKRGANIAMSNMLFYAMPAFCGPETTERFLRAFVDLIRERSDVAKATFYEAGRAMVDASKDEDFKHDLTPFVEPRFFHHWFDSIGANALDPAIPALFLHMATWGARKSNRFRVIHDRSKPVLASRSAFEAMMAQGDQQSTMIGYDRRKFRFPLQATSLEQGDSLEHPQIQIADICAGAIAHYLNRLHAGQLDDLARSIKDSNCLDWGIGVVAPSPAITPEELETEGGDGSNPVDPVVEQLAAHKKS